MSGLVSGVQRVAHLLDGVVDRDQRRQSSRGRYRSDRSDIHFVPRSPFSVPVQHGGRAMDDAVAVCEGLHRFVDGLRRVRGSLHHLAIEAHL